MLMIIYLNQNKKKFREDWWNAKTYTPEGIVCGKSMWDIINKGVTEASVNYPFQGLQKTYLWFKKRRKLVTYCWFWVR